MRKLFFAYIIFLLASFALSAQAVIGISSVPDEGRTSVSLTYVNAVRKAGGVPLVIPMTADSVQIAAILDKVDGIIFTGGEDINPKLYGEENHPKLEDVSDARDAFDMLMMKMAVKKGIRVLGICRGMQMMNVAFGGTMYQDIPSQVPESTLIHRQTIPAHQGIHNIVIDKGSMLYSQIGLDQVKVNSFHHQSVKELSPLFIITARAEDGIVEAIQMIGTDNVCGVQFHPEAFTSAGDYTFLGIFKWLCAE